MHFKPHFYGIFDDYCRKLRSFIISWIGNKYRECNLVLVTDETVIKILLNWIKDLQKYAYSNIFQGLAQLWSKNPQFIGKVIFFTGNKWEWENVQVFCFKHDTANVRKLFVFISSLLYFIDTKRYISSKVLAFFM